MDIIKQILLKMNFKKARQQFHNPKLKLTLEIIKNRGMIYATNGTNVG